MEASDELTFDDEKKASLVLPLWILLLGNVILPTIDQEVVFL